MMRLTNQLMHRATLMQIVEGTDDDDRPTKNRQPVRTIQYANLGVYSSEKYYSQQAKTDVDKRMAIRVDRSINEHDFGIRIGTDDYNIVRIYDDEANRRLELSLSRVKTNS